MHDILTSGERELLLNVPQEQRGPPDARRFKRLTCALPVELWVGAERHLCVALDVGLGGLAIDNPGPVPRAVRYHVRVTLPGHHLEADTRPRWHDVDGTIGMEFESLRPEDMWALLQFMGDEG